MMTLNYKQLKRIAYVLTSHELTSFNEETFYTIFSLNMIFKVNSRAESDQLFALCQHVGFIREGLTKDFEVSVPCQLFSKTKKLTLINQLSLLECLFQSTCTLGCDSVFIILFRDMLNQNYDKLLFVSQLNNFMQDIETKMDNTYSTDILNCLIEAQIVDSNETILELNKQLVNYLISILAQYDLEQHLVISTTLNIIQFDVFSRIFGYNKYVNHLVIDYEALEQFYNKHIVKEFKELNITPNNGRRHSEIQEIFRHSLLVEFEYACAICKTTGKENLIASHIVPVRETDNLMMSGDYHNGLLLCKKHDRLFDQGLITFTGAGKILISSLVAPDTYTKLEINDKIQLDSYYLLHSRINFLKYHHDRIFRK